MFEGEAGYVVVHSDWSVRGHAMVVAPRHVENVSDLSDVEWGRLSRLYRRAERAILDATGADRAIIMKLGIATPHLHLHIYPVGAAMDRASVMDAIDGRSRVQRDGGLVASIRHLLNRRDTQDA